ncbi:hypothetical protein B0H17DRAFT_216551 [Mycena rosella]|uniref:Uncharacterized protein n=1 Tax=Mycena rosella TaxID=1033263 RepID=A0AAD7G5Q6_MYCRO|nr:hypothetical protein B0H17DRAFT_216551 [Mycena rosella]
MKLERCLPEAGRSEFVAEITLEEGNVVQKGWFDDCIAELLDGEYTGRPVKGRVTVHGTHGSTSMSELSVGVWTAYRDHWAQAQAMIGGDTGFDNSKSRYECRRALSGRPLDAESPSYAHMFADKPTVWSGFPRTTLASGGDNLTAAHPYLDFEFQVPTETPVLYSPDADCLKKPRPAPPRTAADAMAATEERLWDGHTRVGYPVEFKPPPKPKSQRCVMNLQALMPITVVGSGVAETRPVAHYLTPYLPAPVIRRTAQADVSEWPIAHPTITEEPLADTVARLLRPHPQSSRYQKAQNLQKNPDPTKGYHGGYYTGLLWKKKVVAEERGILPLLYETVDPEAGDLQQVLHR